MPEKPRIGILLGDAAGVGPELVAKLCASGFINDFCRPIIIGDDRVLELGMRIANVGFSRQVISRVSEATWYDGIPILDQKNLDPDTDFQIGKLSIKSGAACLSMLKTGVDLFLRKEIEGFCFAPLSKAAMKMAGCRYESEHHLLAHLFNYKGPFGEINVLGNLWTTRTTSHIPIKKVSENLTIRTISRAIYLADSSIKHAGIEKPRLGLAALNPHAGENGLCGREEIDVIEPAIEAMRAKGIDVSGPYPSDVLFIKAFSGDFDGVVTMYHDQGQIALKLKGFDEGITIAGGLPAPIVTCGHGTAYDIAGKGIARTSAMENAVKMTCRLASNSNHLYEEKMRQS
ncbi:MAG: 4-hydroxythreonine-4-phosphate dehydrogenase 2 [Spirochaetes bacterium ADurb.Bin110]|jgi:4-hydroxythreonine-4-phosphate dehydrogenase|nr:MAG: 4-hydroxythreonine-4-phosphate dehydrogenase 2 [Spirochaetes bacterium ADurb.Bin110]HNT59569.1 4-hydroxythreonine-4-phosphate dehydrogenase PdxA [Rectinema sp.]HPG96212.1 4-hydroxythreonine-4-phosphate dehydrogenase PdxA [Rectinema sp.]